MGPFTVSYNSKSAFLQSPGQIFRKFIHTPIMIIYKDILTGDELFSDAFEFDDNFQEAFYKLKVKKVQCGGDEIDGAAFGFNASEENPDEEAADASEVETKWDVVNGHQLESGLAYADKKSFGVYFKKKAPNAMAYLKKEIKDCEVWLGSSQNPDASAGYINWDSETDEPYMLFFKHAVIAEKV